jgi:uncharacterized protein
LANIKKTHTIHTKENMKKFLYILVFFFFNNVYCQDTLVDNNSKWTGNLNNGLKQGLWREHLFYSDFNDYQIVSEGNYVNGKKQGTWKFYGLSHWGSMELTSHGNFENDIKEGKWVHKVGYEYQTGNYKNGVKHGIWLSYDLEVCDSIVYIKGSYVNGIPDGLWQLFDPETGKLRASGKMSKGQMEGVWKTSGCIGELRINPDTVIYNLSIENLVYDIVQDCEALYETDNKIGEWKYFHYDTTLVSSLGKYINGKKEGEWKLYHPNGVLEYEGKYNEGKKEGIWKEYYDNGKLKCVEMYKNGKLNGNSFFYTQEGYLIITGNFTNGFRSGEWKSYSKDSIILVKGYYNGLPDNPESERPDQPRCGLEKSKYAVERILNTNSYYLPSSNRHGFWEEYDFNGVLKERGAYNNGKKEGKWEEYYNGSLASVYNYKNDLKDGDFVEFNWYYKYVWRSGTYENGKIEVLHEFNEAEGQTKEEYLQNIN